LAVVASQLMLRSSLESSSLTPSWQAAFRALCGSSLAARFDLAFDLLIPENSKTDTNGDGRNCSLATITASMPLALAKRAQKTRVGLPRAAEDLPLGKNNGPGENRKTDQNGFHNRPMTPFVLDHFQRFTLKKEGSGSFESQFVS